MTAVRGDKVYAECYKRTERLKRGDLVIRGKVAHLVEQIEPTETGMVEIVFYGSSELQDPDTVVTVLILL